MIWQVYLNLNNLRIFSLLKRNISIDQFDYLFLRIELLFSSICFSINPYNPVYRHVDAR